MATLASVQLYSVQDYRPLDDTEEFSSTTERALQVLDITQNDLASTTPTRSLNDIVRIELSCSHYVRWAAIDHFAEKVLQVAVMSRFDANPKVDNCLSHVVRFTPHGRSILLHSQWGLRKESAVSGFVQTTEQVLLVSVKLFVTIALGFRLYEFSQIGSFDSSEFKSLFQSNDQKGVTSLVRFLARFDKTWLQLILASPALIGSFKALWDGCQSRPLSQDDLLKLQVDVARHSQPASISIWSDNVRQLITVPGFATISERLQKAEHHIRSDGRISVKKRKELFKEVQRLSLEGRGLSRLNAMQSLAKIVHSVSIKDLAVMQAAGYPQEALLQILEIKAQALQVLRMLSARDPNIQVKHSLVSTIYASYLLWWLGMGNFKTQMIFGIFKASKTVLEVLFLKEVIESILEAVRCPDKPGFRMFYGDYEVWANELTVDCFNEFVKQFRLISWNEKLQPFLDQLKNFHLQGVDTLDLSSKSLTANETQAILQILNLKMNLKVLFLRNNLIGKNAARIDFPPGLLHLDLAYNSIGDEIAGLEWPRNLQTLDLSENQIGPEGAAKLQLPASLQVLDLRVNQIGPDGSAKLQLPASLLVLDLTGNQLGDEGAAKLQFPPFLQDLDLTNNNIGDSGAANLTFPSSLQSLDLSFNQIGPDGAAKLQLPSTLQVLSLGFNQLGPKGAANLQLPPSLQKLYLNSNSIRNGAAKLQLPASLQALDLGANQVGDDGAAKLQLPASLQWLDLHNNQIGPDGAAKLQLPSTLQVLSLGFNQLGPKGAANLQLPPALQELYLSNNQIGNRTRLQLPASLQVLVLNSNQIGNEGAAQLQLPYSLQGLDLSSNQIGPEGAANLQLPPALQELYLLNNQIGPKGASKLQLPSSLKKLNLLNNQLGPDGAAQLRLPVFLQTLRLGMNQLGPNGTVKLQLPSSLQELWLDSNQLGPNGPVTLQLPFSLQKLDLGHNQIGPDGAAKLQLPPSLQTLDLTFNQIGDSGAIRLRLPAALQRLYLGSNLIKDAGVKALFQKVPQTNLTIISLAGNKYNASVLNERVVLQRAALLRRCQDKLCHANTPLQEDPFSDEPQTSSATRRATPFFSWLNSPLKAVAGRIDACARAIVHRLDAGVTSALNSIGSSLRSTLSDYPSYFPNLHSSYFYDHVTIAGQHTLAMAASRVIVSVSAGYLAHHSMLYIRA